MSVLCVQAKMWNNYCLSALVAFSLIGAAYAAPASQPSSLGQPSVSELVKALSDPRNEARADAAAAIRQILAKDPAPESRSKANWQRRLESIKPDTSLKEARQILFPDLTDEQREKLPSMGAGSLGGGSMVYDLDDYWRVRLSYLRDGGNSKIAQPPVLERWVRSVWVTPPADFTGAWVTWYVNGQKAREIQIVNGKSDGTFTSFYDDGSRCFEQHYKQGVCDGPDTGYHRSGKKSYEGQYKADKQVGTWRWFSEDGQVTGVREYGAGQ